MMMWGTMTTSMLESQLIHTLWNLPRNEDRMRLPAIPPTNIPNLMSNTGKRKNVRNIKGKPHHPLLYEIAFLVTRVSRLALHVFFHLAHPC
jgi:hypothetical protein